MRNPRGIAGKCPTDPGLNFTLTMDRRALKRNKHVKKRHGSKKLYLDETRGG